MRRTLTYAAIGATLLYADVGEASAQASEEADTARARELFNEGLSFADRSRWQEAADRFRGALALRTAPAVEFNLASALVELGQYPEASALVASVLSDENVAADLRQRAETLLENMGRRGGTIVVHVVGDSDGVAITIDDYTIPSERLGSGVPTTSGRHVVTATAQSSVVASEEITVSRGGRHEVRLAVAPTPVEVATTTVPDPNPLEPGQTDDDGSVFEQWWFWTAVGALAVVTTVVILLVSTDPGVEDPVTGDFQPGVIYWE